jgi:hypothetical protein
MLVELIAAVIMMFLSGTCLWAGMKLTKVDGKYLGMLAVAVVSGLVGAVVPGIVGALLGTIVMFVLICKWTDAEFWPDAVLMVLVARFVAVAGTVFLLGVFG